MWIGTITGANAGTFKKVTTAPNPDIPIEDDHYNMIDHKEIEMAAPIKSLADTINKLIIYSAPSLQPTKIVAPNIVNLALC